MPKALNTPSTMSTDNYPPITTRLSSGTYIARAAGWSCSSTSSHQMAASNLVRKYLGDGFVAVKSPSLKAQAAQAMRGRRDLRDWEWEVFIIEAV